MNTQQSANKLHLAFLALLALAAIALPSRVYSETLYIAVASNFMSTAKSLIKDFEAQQQHTAKAAFGSSGKFVAQIKHGAPFDVFLSADNKMPSFLADNKLAKAESQFTYALGQLVLCSTSILPTNKSLGSLLQSRGTAKLAYANERLAPYGLAASQVLKRLNILETPKSTWVRGENVAQVFQFLVSGNAQLAFVANAQVKTKEHPEIKSCRSIPSELYDPIQQDAILLNRGLSSEAARSFIQYLRNDKARQIIEQHGYRTATPNTLMPVK